MQILKFVDIGEGITEGHVQKWLVSDGDAVKEDQPIVQIETDKAVVNLPSPAGGTVRIAAKENTTVNIGDVIAWIGDPSELSSMHVQQAPPQLQEKKEVEAVQSQQEQKEAVQEGRNGAIATPAIRRLARELGIDIARVRGTGPEGRVLENDIRAAAVRLRQQANAAPKFSETLEEQHTGEVERIPLSQTRKAIARNMELSLLIPSAAHMDLINATYLYRIVKKEKPNAEKLGVKLSFLPFIIKAVVEALRENQRFNASYDHETQEIILKKYYNIGLAAEGPDGLKVVVIKQADKKSILQIAKEIQELHEKVISRTIALDEMRDSTFTITNIGSLGGGYLSVPIINPPEVAILGIHLIRDSAVIEDGQIKIGKVLPFSLVFDHRAVDGADAVLFGNALIKYLEDPEFLEMLG
ncbi:MAG: 2-oxo acid dehydrogenase subunit E2 [Candidatus Marsarchaeota archaeon]|jgi:pyruvate dehydrogenase E2 component (dihydrolipoamide acetyltransferase)|nr:2-oxo acid dehydrogenase subunit E2 [Candidatus Marsarchaeota archaeon]